MEALFVYLIKSGALIGMFWVAYYFLLRKETFFKSNRWYLLFGLVTAVILPLVTFKKVVWVEPLQDSLVWTQVPVSGAPEEAFEINWMLVWGIIYAIGITTFLLRFCTDFYALKKALKGKKVLQQADFKFVDTTENISPFSYFNYIVYNSSLYSPSELQNILEHEKVHSDQHHSADVLITRIFCIVFWFNPFVWLYKKSILQNLEFIADSEATKNIPDKKSYQITLLKVTAHENCVDITNHFYQSLIKKRIVMLNKNQSKKTNSWKYALIIPAIAAFMFYFQVQVIAQEKTAPPKTEETIVQNGVRVTVDKNTSDAEMKSDAALLKKEHDVTLKFSKVKRNKNGEIIAIKAEFKDKNGKKGITMVDGDVPIKPISFYKNINGSIGFGNGNEMRIIRTEIADAGSEDDFSFDFDITGAPEAPEPPEMPAMPGDVHPVAPRHPVHPARADKNIMIRKTPGGQPMVIVDGEVIVDTEKILADIEPLDGNFVYSYSADGDDMVIDKKEIRKITKDAMEKARIEMKKARPEMEDAHRNMEKARIEMRKNHSELSNDEMRRTRQEIEQAHEELRKAHLEMEKLHKELDKVRHEQKKQ